ncbi:Uncharacterized protein FKW44_022094, partial [Caligus rogercresseyi]
LPLKYLNNNISCTGSLSPVCLVMTQLDFLTRKALKTELIQYMEQGDWRKVLEFYEEKDQYREPLLVWIRPNVEILKFLESELLFRGLKEVWLLEASIKEW